jgi:hypothetical protein
MLLTQLFQNIEKERKPSFAKSNASSFEATQDEE